MTDTDETLPTEGDIVAGKYLVDKVLGRGGMGIVVGATHTLLDQKVAIKFLTAEAQGEMLERFGREARAVAKLKSEYVARVYDVGALEDNTPYMVMEYLAGEDLGDVSKRRGALPVETAVLYIMQACHAVAEAHGAGIIHRDLKPSNLFLTTSPDGGDCVKVLDFGISKDTSAESTSMEEEDGELTKTSMVLGTPYYMSPEQMRSARSVDARSDVWSMGAILYQLLCNDKPFRAASFPELVVKVLQEEPPAPSTRRMDLPPGLQRVVMRCLEKQPQQRYANIGEFAIELAPYGPPEADALAERIARLVVRTSQVALPAVSRRHVARGVSAESVASMTPAGQVEAAGPFSSRNPQSISSPTLQPTLPSAGVPSTGGPGFVRERRNSEPSTLTAASVETVPAPTGGVKRPLMLLGAAALLAAAVGIGLGMVGRSDGAGEGPDARPASTGAKPDITAAPDATTTSTAADTAPSASASASSAPTAADPLRQRPVGGRLPEPAPVGPEPQPPPGPEPTTTTTQTAAQPPPPPVVTPPTPPPPPVVNPRPPAPVVVPRPPPPVKPPPPKNPLDMTIK